MSAMVLGLLPASASANDPATHQYSSNLTQICVDGEIVTTVGDGGGAGGAGGGLAEVCGGGETGVVGGGGDVGGVGAGGTAGSAAPGQVGSLPFTGLDLGLLAAVAVALVAGGLLLRRRRSQPAGA